MCPGLAQLVRSFARNSEKWSRSKTSNEKYNDILQPLPVPLGAWKEVTLDFVTGLPRVGEYNEICVIIDWLTKKTASYLLCRQNWCSRHCSLILLACLSTPWSTSLHYLWSWNAVHQWLLVSSRTTTRGHSSSFYSIPPRDRWPDWER